MPKKRFILTWKKGKTQTGDIELDTPVIALNLSMIDRQLKKAGLRELKELVGAESEDEWLSIQEVLSAFEKARAFFTDHPETLPFSDLVIEDIPVATKAIRALPKKSVLRLKIIK